MKSRFDPGKGTAKNSSIAPSFFRSRVPPSIIIRNSDNGESIFKELPESTVADPFRPWIGEIIYHTTRRRRYRESRALINAWDTRFAECCNLDLFLYKMNTDPASMKWRICANGHRFHKSSSCPVCPVCEKGKMNGDFGRIAAPARRALENAGIRTLPELAAFREQEVLQWHGVGPNAVGALKEVLKAQGLAFKKL